MYSSLTFNVRAGEVGAEEWEGFKRDLSKQNQHTGGRGGTRMRAIMYDTHLSVRPGGDAPLLFLFLSKEAGRGSVFSVSLSAPVI